MKKIIITCLFITASMMAICQNVGIGTSNPTEKLHVNGNMKADTVKPAAIKFTPNAGSGKILTSDANGNASWQASAAASAEGAGSWGDCSMNGIYGYQAFGDTAGAEDDHFGYKVAISGDFAIVSAPFDDIGANTDQGSVSFFHFNGSSWDMTQKIVEAAGSAGDYFGCSVSISGNYAVVGLVGDDIGANTDQGSAMVYYYNGSNWIFLQKLTDPTGAVADLFGSSVAIDGNFIIGTAKEDDIGVNPDQGSACIFQLVAGNWVYMQKIYDIFGSTEDYFGVSVAISGNNIIVGEPGDDITVNTDQGSVLFYYFNGSSWVLRIKLTDANGQADGSFGYSVSISGSYAVVASPVYDYAVTDQGSVNIYKLNGANWNFVQKITMEEPATFEGFGYSVAISGNYLVVGAINDDIGTWNNNKGSVTIYQKVGIGWSKLQFVYDKMGAEDDQFGFSVAFDGSTKRFLTSAFAYGNGSGKVLFGKVY